MRNEKKHFLMSIIFGIVIILVMLFLYFNSANFIKPPLIILPSTSDEEEIEYKNKYKITDVIVTKDNALEVIASLERPLEYTYTLNKSVFAFSQVKQKNSVVFASNDSIKVLSDDKDTLVNGEFVYIMSQNSVETFNKSDFSNDEILGIPTYEDISNVSSAQIVEENSKKFIQIIDNTDNIVKEYYINLTNGMLTKYIVREDDVIINEIIVENIIIEEQDPNIFLMI